jgi:hypothetical protein
MCFFIYYCTFGGNWLLLLVPPHSPENVQHILKKRNRHSVVKYFLSRKIKELAGRDNELPLSSLSHMHKNNVPFLRHELVL